MIKKIYRYLWTRESLPNPRKTSHNITQMRE
ncbi:hypothetical protein ACFW04_009137 [Cataglyphis niger]